MSYKKKKLSHKYNMTLITSEIFTGLAFFSLESVHLIKLTDT